MTFNCLIFLGTEEDFKYWSSDFLSHFNDAREKSKETACHCTSESQSTGNTCYQKQEDLEENKTQDVEVKLSSGSVNPVVP